MSWLDSAIGLVGDGLNAGANLFGSWLGADATNRASEQSMKVAKMNLQSQEKWNQLNYDNMLAEQENYRVSKEVLCLG